MHPILGNRARLGAYLLGWAPFAILFTVQGLAHQRFGAALTEGLVAAYGAAFLFLSCWYLCRALPPSATPAYRLVTTWSAASAFMGSLWAGILFGALHGLGRLFPKLASVPAPKAHPWEGFLLTATSGAILYILTVALHYLMIALDERRDAEARESDLRALAREAELKALRAQLNPHFLFNSLNSISALTSADPAKAREMCVLLSDFLRKSLKLGERPTVRLSEELDLVRNYLAIEKIRFGARLNVAWDLDLEAERAELPTLLLQPLVENAIKHGIAQLTEGGTIRIATRREGGFVAVRVENPVDPDAEAPQGLGLGLRQVKERLQATHAGRAFFEARVRDQRHEVVLNFPVEEA